MGGQVSDDRRLTKGPGPRGPGPRGPTACRVPTGPRAERYRPNDPCRSGPGGLIIPTGPRALTRGATGKEARGNQFFSRARHYACNARGKLQNAYSSSKTNPHAPAAICEASVSSDSSTGDYVNTTRREDRCSNDSPQPRDYARIVDSQENSSGIPSPTLSQEDNRTVPRRMHETRKLSAPAGTGSHCSQVLGPRGSQWWEESKHRHQFPNGPRRSYSQCETAVRKLEAMQSLLMNGTAFVGPPRLCEVQPKLALGVGTVVTAAWHNIDRMPNNGEKAVDLSDPERSLTGHGIVFTKLRFVVVIKQFESHCLCLPVHTYNKAGLQFKSARERAQHMAIRDVKEVDEDVGSAGSRGRDSENGHRGVLKVEHDPRWGGWRLHGPSYVKLTDMMSIYYGTSPCGIVGHILPEDVPMLRTQWRNVMTGA